MGLHDSYGVHAVKEIFVWSVEENVVSEMEMVKKEYWKVSERRKITRVLEWGEETEIVHVLGSGARIFFWYSVQVVGGVIDYEMGFFKGEW